MQLKYSLLFTFIKIKNSYKINNKFNTLENKILFIKNYDIKEIKMKYIKQPFINNKSFLY